MLEHACVSLSSHEKVKILFEEVFGFEKLYSFKIDPRVMLSLFNIETSAEAFVYDCENSKLEIFVVENMRFPSPGFRHICLSFADRDSILRKAKERGYLIKEYKFEDRTVVFIQDFDGNLYEIKKRQ